uniref:Piezo non-specific cation channel R-Ras-binding domain-containing protein n=1 Tax=Panagrolaimus superbus TaxID=310955 RepID=A0A914YPY7_9BILA
MKVPFLYELGVLTDWIWKDTSLNLGDWITLHDIYQKIANLKCIRKWEEDFPSPKGVKQRPFIKYGYGGVLLVLIILIIWFPLVLFSMANTVGTRSTPVMCTCRLSIAGYQPLFDSTAQLGDIQPLTPMEYESLYYKYRTSKTALSYIADYTELDVVKATINGNSASRWQISPPAREYLMANLNGSQSMSMQFEWNFKRAPDENLQYGVVEDFRIIELPPGDNIRQELIAMIDGNSTTPILIPDLFPSMVKVPGEGKSEHVEALLREHLKGSKVSIETTYADVLLELVSANGMEYWRLKMIDSNFDPVRKLDPIIRENLVFYGFVDKVFPKSFSFITGGGILGLYISIVFLLGQYIRGFVVDSMQMIMFEELPNVDKILDLCHKIFFVRDVSRFDLEEALYANLVFIFRSPATLIRWTKERPT